MKMSYQKAVQTALTTERHGTPKKALAAWIAAYQSTGRYDEAGRIFCGQECVRIFNSLYDFGQPVVFWPGAREGEGKTGSTRGVAYMMNSSPMVQVTGQAGGMCLTHVAIAEYCNIPDGIEVPANA